MGPVGASVVDEDVVEAVVGVDGGVVDGGVVVVDDEAGVLAGAGARVVVGEAVGDCESEFGPEHALEARAITTITEQRRRRELTGAERYRQLDRMDRLSSDQQAVGVGIDPVTLLDGHTQERRFGHRTTPVLL